MVARALQNRGLIPSSPLNVSMNVIPNMNVGGMGTPRTTPFSTFTTPRSYSALNVGGMSMGANNPGGRFSALTGMGGNAAGGTQMLPQNTFAAGMEQGAKNVYAKPAFVRPTQQKPNVPPNQLGQNLLDFASSPQGIGFARGLLEASGYSTTPVSFGQAIAQGLGYMTEADQTEAERKQQEFENLLLERQLTLQEQEAAKPEGIFTQTLIDVPDGKGGTIKQLVNVAPDGKISTIGGGGTNININDGTSKGYEKVNEKYAAEYIKWIETGSYQVELENLKKLDESLDTLRNKNVTGAIIGLTPNAVLSVLNPEALNLQDNIRSIVFQGLRATLGAQFTEREGNRLVEAAFNPMLSEEMNIVRLERMRERIKAMIESKQAAVTHFQNNNGDMSGYTGQATFNLDEAVANENDIAINNGKDAFLSTIYSVDDYKDFSNQEFVEYFQNAQPEEQKFIIENAEAIGMDVN